jgi:hypothetical protein
MLEYLHPSLAAAQCSAFPPLTLRTRLPFDRDLRITSEGVVVDQCCRYWWSGKTERAIGLRQSGFEYVVLLDTGLEWKLPYGPEGSAPSIGHYLLEGWQPPRRC